MCLALKLADGPCSHQRAVDHEFDNMRMIGRFLNPAPGSIQIPGIDADGEVLPLRGDLGGDHFIYVDFNQRFDLDARIADALTRGLSDIAKKLTLNKRRAGLLLSDVSGHQMSDAMIGAVVHHLFLMGVGYELGAHGEVTPAVFEEINNRLYYSSGLGGKFVTMLYGEVWDNGVFKFITGGHPHPLVFSHEWDRFVNIIPERIKAIPPLGVAPCTRNLDRTRMQREDYEMEGMAVNQIELMMPGDILLLCSDGFWDHYGGRMHELEATLRSHKAQRSSSIVGEISEAIRDHGDQADDITYLIVKRT